MFRFDVFDTVLLFALHVYVVFMRLNLVSFIADVCTSLMDHLDTEGLFRKSGSVVRVKSLRVSDLRFGSLERLSPVAVFNSGRVVLTL